MSRRFVPWKFFDNLTLIHYLIVRVIFFKFVNIRWRLLSSSCYCRLGRLTLIISLKIWSIFHLFWSLIFVMWHLHLHKYFPFHLFILITDKITLFAQKFYIRFGNIILFDILLGACELMVITLTLSEVPHVLHLIIRSLCIPKLVSTVFRTSYIITLSQLRIWIVVS